MESRASAYAVRTRAKVRIPLTEQPRSARSSLSARRRSLTAGEKLALLIMTNRHPCARSRPLYEQDARGDCG